MDAITNLASNVASFSVSCSIYYKIAYTMRKTMIPPLLIACYFIYRHLKLARFVVVDTSVVAYCYSTARNLSVLCGAPLHRTETYVDFTLLIQDMHHMACPSSL